MKSFLNSNIGRLRLLAVLEGSSLLILLFISMPLKQLYNMTLLTSILGPIHGILFLLFVISAINISIENNLKFKKTTWKILIACFTPFGTIYIDYKILKPLYEIHLKKIK
ncbi:hypothetical protein BA195_07965 [Tenacibaculum soleae]|uniref:DUF3817 domain-containing protein n=1 Tax=Tenacibaculum soleae TaxID=447689 RepID=A0A1B9XZ66_9FLAO|nr:DUF3817 domain-containing protein [Tenacibaculum soleae]OCK42834.1 hypothetical protein BA195_07965 [Tenacibaculum soleae]